MNYVWRPTLFLPGPVDVHPDVLAAAAQPMMGHRTAKAADILHELDLGLRPWLGVSTPVYVLTASATLAMEATVRNLVRKKMLIAESGVFAERWRIAAAACGREVAVVQGPLETGVTPEALDAALSQPGIEAVALVAVETGTGVAAPLEALLDVCAKHPDVLVLVDAVSSAGGMPVPGVRCDAVFTASQKALAMPPGLTFLALSPRALARAATMEGRGLYADFARVDRFHRSGGSPFTPALPVVYAALAQVRRLAAEGQEARWARHRAKRDRWLAIAPHPVFASPAPTVAVHRVPEGFDPLGFLRTVEAKTGFVLAPGIGPLESTTYRVGLMGESQVADIEHLADALRSCLP